MATSGRRAGGGVALVVVAATALGLVMPSPGIGAAMGGHTPVTAVPPAAPGGDEPPGSLLLIASPAFVPLRLRPPDLALPLDPRFTAAHTIVAGDTLWNIARSSGTTAEDIAITNGLTTDAILPIGLVLTVPPPGTTPRVLRVGPARAAASAPSRTSVPLRPRPTVPIALPSSSPIERLALLWPSGGTVTSRFGWRVHPIFGSREFHTGMDIATRYGSPVVAALSGVVRFVGWKSGYGRIVVLYHAGGIETAYSHLSAATVSPGEHVSEGQMIGRIGNSGWSTGPHLFFEVRRNGVPLDPARYLN